MAMIAVGGVGETGGRLAMAGAVGEKAFLGGRKVSVNVWRPSGRRRRGVVVCGKRMGGYMSSTVADKEMEEGMEYRRMVYGQEDWIRHRSSARHGRHLASIASSRVIMALGPPVFSLTAVAAVVTVFNEAVAWGILPGWVPVLHISSVPFSLTAPALALLLVFRTNASYSRFDEARKTWAMNVNRCRDVCRQALTFMRSPGDAPKLESFLHHVVAFPYALKNQLCEGEELERELDGLLDDAEIASVLSATHRANYVLQVMSELVTSSGVSDMERAIMDRNFTQLQDNVGACERIFKTPIPLSYTRLTSRFLIIWHMALPLGLWDDCRWLTIPAVFLNAAALLCIEEVGVVIEEPFSSLALGSICNTVKNNVASLAEAHAERARKSHRKTHQSFEAKL